MISAEPIREEYYLATVSAWPRPPRDTDTLPTRELGRLPAMQQGRDYIKGCKKTLLRTRFDEQESKEAAAPQSKTVFSA